MTADGQDAYGFVSSGESTDVLDFFGGLRDDITRSRSAGLGRLALGYVLRMCSIY